MKTFNAARIEIIRLNQDVIVTSGESGAGEESQTGGGTNFDNEP